MSEINKVKELEEKIKDMLHFKKQLKEVPDEFVAGVVGIVCFKSVERFTNIYLNKLNDELNEVKPTAKRSLIQEIKNSLDAVENSSEEDSEIEESDAMWDLSVVIAENQALFLEILEKNKDD